MEILKFDESGASSPSRKRSGRGAILVTFVALVFGAGTALASGTLTVNGDNTIALDQGVAQSVQCDTSIGVTFGAPYNTVEEEFLLESILISGIDTRTQAESSSDDNKDHCLGKYFTIKVYDSTGALSVFCEGASGTPDTGCASDGKSAKLQVTTNSVDKTANTLLYQFSKKMLTGEPGIVRVKNVTVESSDI
jgi:hypothetical protein